jgi:antitoxin VapB
MAVLIKDEEADGLIRALAHRTGEGITEAVKKAMAERLERVPLSEQEIAARRQRIDDVLVKIDALPTVDQRSAEEIIGYNDHGHFG